MDGTLDSSGTVTFGSNTYTHTADGFSDGIGGGVGAESDFKGLIDDVRIYNRALTADEIKRLYQIGGGR